MHALQSKLPLRIVPEEAFADGAQGPGNHLHRAHHPERRNRQQRVHQRDNLRPRAGAANYPSGIVNALLHTTANVDHYRSRSGLLDVIVN